MLKTSLRLSMRLSMLAYKACRAALRGAPAASAGPVQGVLGAPAARAARNARGLPAAHDRLLGQRTSPAPRLHRHHGAPARPARCQHQPHLRASILLQQAQRLDRLETPMGPQVGKSRVSAARCQCRETDAGAAARPGGLHWGALLSWGVSSQRPWSCASPHAVPVHVSTAQRNTAWCRTPLWIRGLKHVCSRCFKRFKTQD